LCSAVAFATQPPNRVHYCHCSMCRRATGAPFAVLAWVRREDVRWVSGKPTLVRSSPIASRGFCRRCGTSLLLQYDAAPETALMLGAFDRPDLLVPTYHYGVEARLPWIDCASGLPARATKEKFAGQPP
jgi:hypothetical protein